MGLMECLLSQRFALIFVSSLILLCGQVLVQSAPKRMQLPDFGTRDGVAILDPNVGVALTREHVSAHNRVGRQRSVVMRRNTKASSFHSGIVSKSATGSTSEISVDDPIEILKRTVRVSVAVEKRNPRASSSIEAPGTAFFFSFVQLAAMSQWLKLEFNSHMPRYGGQERPMHRKGGFGMTKCRCPSDLQFLVLN